MSPGLSDALMGCALLALVLALVVGIPLLAIILYDIWHQRRQHLRIVTERTPCKTGCHDWILPANGRSGYCERCGTAFPHRHDPRRSTTAVLEAKPAEGSWGRA